MFTIDVVLAVIAADHPRDPQVIVDGSCRLPSEPLGPDDTSDGVASRLLERLTGVGSRWVRLRPCGFLDRPGSSKAVLFAAEMPELVPLLEAGPSWRPISGLIADPGRHAFETLQLLTKVTFPS